MDYVNFNLDEMGVPELVRLLEYHDRRYWELGEPEIPDSRYDAIVEALRRLDPGNPLLEKVYAPAVFSAGKIRHKEPMLSLAKAYNLKEILTWAKKYARSDDEKLLVQPKYDGISAKFENGILATRGDGEFGEDVTDKVPLIELEAPGYTGVLDRPARGEIVIKDEDFATIYSRIRKKDGNLYKNSRNAVAGIMGLKDISLMLAQHAKLTLVDYSLVSCEVTLAELESRWVDIKTRMAALPYPQDGLVVKFADAALRKELGFTAHHPRGEIAYKFTNIQRKSVLLGVEWSFGKNCLTPVAELEPVEISGITIKRATLHNVQNIENMDIQIGDKVIVERAGDVIPYIVDSSPGENRRSAIIDSCPCCKSTLGRRGPELVCPNPDCPETNLQRLLGTVKNLGIEHLGEPTLRKLVEVCRVRKTVDLFAVTVEDVLKLEGFAAKSAGNLVAEIQKARNIEDYKLLASLNIPGIGPNVAKMILKEISFAALRTADFERLIDINGVGPERAAALIATMKENQEELDDLLAAVTLVEKTEETGGGKTICFTGRMPEKRSFYENLARDAGYEPVGDAGATLSLLVADDPDGNSSKLRNARKYGTRIISLDEFLTEISAREAAGTTTETPVQGELF